MTSLFNFREQQQLPLKQKVADEIRLAILCGQLKPGDRLVESTIAEQMGISRGPVREALGQLEQEGLVIVEPYKSTAVANISEDEINEVLLPARQILEGFTMKKTAQIIGERDFQKLEIIIGEMARGAAGNNLRVVVDKDIEFHYYLIGLPGYKSLVQLWQGMVNRARINFYQQGLIKDMNTVVDEHEGLLRILRTKDPDKISKAFVEHAFQQFPPRESIKPGEETDKKLLVQAAGVDGRSQGCAEFGLAAAD